MIIRQVFPSLTERDCLNTTQHGFRLVHFCLSALLDAFVNIMHMLDGNSTVDMVYLDFSKAFDKVDHGILLHKLRAVGITGNIGFWLFHFLTDRSHFLRLPGVLVKTPCVKWRPTVNCFGTSPVLDYDY